jgi:hypothetical protein
MGMVDGLLLSQTVLRGQGLFPPPGLSIEEHIRDAVIRQGKTLQSSYSHGTYTSQVDTEVWQAKGIAASSSATWDLYTGTDLTDLNDGTAAFRTIRFAAVAILQCEDATSGVRVGGASSNEWVGFFAASGDKQDIFLDGPPWQAGSPAGKAVTSTTKNLKVENLSTTKEVIVLVVLGGSIQVSGGLMGVLGLTYP